MGPPRPLVRRSRRKARTLVNIVALTKKELDSKKKHRGVCVLRLVVGAPRSRRCVCSHPDAGRERERERERESMSRFVNIANSATTVARFSRPVRVFSPSPLRPTTPAAAWCHTARELTPARPIPLATNRNCRAPWRSSASRPACRRRVRSFSAPALRSSPSA